MLLEQRTYVLHASVLPTDYLEAYATIGLPVQRRILGGFAGYYVTDIGRQNELNHFWVYSSLDDRRVRRARLAEEPEWRRCVEIVRPMIMSMENRIMYPTDFSPRPTIDAGGGLVEE